LEIYKMANGVGRALDAATSHDGNYPTIASDSTSKFIPVVWSKKMLRNFYETTAFLEISNTDYQGEIKGQGDKVVIRTTPDITINPYLVGQTLDYEVPEKANKELNIDQAYSWSFRLDDIDDVQTDLPLMEKFASDAGEKLKIKIDQECFTYVVGKADSDNRGATAGAISGNIDLGATGTNGDAALAVTKTTATDFVVDFNTVLDEADIPSEDRWVVLPAWFCALLKKSDLKQADITGDATGVIGMVDRTKVIQSNNLYHVTEGTAELFYCLAGTKEAMTFALQLTKTGSLEIPDSFGTYMRGLSVYGREVIQGTALVEAVAIRG
jgi:hypothetical protein